MSLVGWSYEDVRVFLRGFYRHGKDFWTLHNTSLHQHPPNEIESFHNLLLSKVQNLLVLGPLRVQFDLSDKIQAYCAFKAFFQLKSSEQFSDSHFTDPDSIKYVELYKSLATEMQTLFSELVSRSQANELITSPSEASPMLSVTESSGQEQQPQPQQQPFPMLETSSHQERTVAVNPSAHHLPENNSLFCSQKKPSFGVTLPGGGGVTGQKKRLPLEVLPASSEIEKILSFQNLTPRLRLILPHNKTMRAVIKHLHKKWNIPRKSMQICLRADPTVLVPVWGIQCRSSAWDLFQSLACPSRFHLYYFISEISLTVPIPPPVKLTGKENYHRSLISHSSSAEVTYAYQQENSHLSSAIFPSSSSELPSNHLNSSASDRVETVSPSDYPSTTGVAPLTPSRQSPSSQHRPCPPSSPSSQAGVNQAQPNQPFFHLIADDNAQSGFGDDTSASRFLRSPRTPLSFFFENSLPSLEASPSMLLFSDFFNRSNSRLNVDSMDGASRPQLLLQSQQLQQQLQSPVHSTPSSISFSQNGQPPTLPLPLPQQQQQQQQPSLSGSNDFSLGGQDQLSNSSFDSLFDQQSIFQKVGAKRGRDSQSQH